MRSDSSHDGKGQSLFITCFRLSVVAVSLLIGVALAATPAIGPTRYSQTSNKELRREALHLVQQIRELLRYHHRRERELLAEYDRKERVQSTAAKPARREWLDATDRLHEATMKRYKERYWSDAILLADEILRRLPKEKRRADILPIYQRPTNVLGVRAVADHLELVAKRLSDSRGS